jgi:hypothetical protein
MTTTLDRLEIATPCKASWDGMSGDDRVRFCGLCKLNVYNLSGMTREQAETLVRTSEGRVCVRMFKRADGTVITQDCPVGLAARMKRKARLAIAGLAAMILGAAGAAVALRGENGPYGKVVRWIAGEETTSPPLMGAPRATHVMGRMVMRPTPPTPPAQTPTLPTQTATR